MWTTNKGCAWGFFFNFKYSHQTPKNRPIQVTPNAIKQKVTEVYREHQSHTILFTNCQASMVHSKRITFHHFCIKMTSFFYITFGVPQHNAFTSYKFLGQILFCLFFSFSNPLVHYSTAELRGDELNLYPNPYIVS